MGEWLGFGKKTQRATAGGNIIAVGNLSNSDDVKPYIGESYERLSRKEMRELYRRVDIFVDCSVIQALV